MIGSFLANKALFYSLALKLVLMSFSHYILHYSEQSLLYPMAFTSSVILN
jgi:hypothetical protein